MAKATRKNINPYYTAVKCKYCSHVYIPRSEKPKVCPKCQRPFNAKVLNEMSYTGWRRDLMKLNSLV